MLFLNDFSFRTPGGSSGGEAALLGAGKFYIEFSVYYIQLNNCFSFINRSITFGNWI